MRSIVDRRLSMCEVRAATGRPGSDCEPQGVAIDAPLVTVNSFTVTIHRHWWQSPRNPQPHPLSIHNAVCVVFLVGARVGQQFVTEAGCRASVLLSSWRSSSWVRSCARLAILVCCGWLCPNLDLSSQPLGFRHDPPLHRCVTRPNHDVLRPGGLGRGTAKTRSGSTKPTRLGGDEKDRAISSRLH